MPVRGVRGAVAVTENNKTQILKATQELLEAILARNPEMKSEEFASVFFSVTKDLNAAFPAEAARLIGWDEVPLFDVQEISTPDSLEMCIRVLIHWNTALPQAEIQHVYLGKARKLRPDLIGNSLD